MSEHAAGAIVPVDAEVATLAALLRRWENSTLSTLDAALLIKRAAGKIDRACWCAEDVCCRAHGPGPWKHADPHKNCVLR